MAATLRERCERRLTGLKAARQPYEAEAKEIASLAQPARSRWLASEANKNTRQRNRRLNSSHGIFAFRALQGGMTSGLSSPSRPWFNEQTYQDEINEDPEARAWLDEVVRLKYAFLAGTNFYDAAKTGYLELGLFATEACIMLEDVNRGAVCHQLTFGEYWIGVGASLTADTLFRRCPLTVNQVMAYADRGFFRKDLIRQQIKDAYDRGDYQTPCDFYHAIEPNDDQDGAYQDWRGKPFRSLYWDAEDSRKQDDLDYVHLKGFEEQPFWAPRWDTAGGDTWGTGPGHDALPDLRELQMQVKRKGEATDFLVKPEMVAPSKLKLKRQPGAVTSAATADIEKVSVPYEMPYQAVNAIMEDVAKCKEAVNQATYADLFMAITNMRGIQPRSIEEIAARNEEKLTQLGPVIERVNNEKLRIALDRVHGIMERAGLLPPAPQSLQGQELKIEFVSILTQMQRMVGLGQIERTAGFIGGLVATFPDAADKLNYDEAIDEYADRAGAPAKMIRSGKEVEEIRNGRAQQKNMEAMIAAAPAAKDGATAAKVLSEVGGGAMPIAGAMPL